MGKRIDHIFCQSCRALALTRLSDLKTRFLCARPILDITQLHGRTAPPAARERRVIRVLGEEGHPSDTPIQDVIHLIGPATPTPPGSHRPATIPHAPPFAPAAIGGVVARRGCNRSGWAPKPISSGGGCSGSARSAAARRRTTAAGRAACVCSNRPAAPRSSWPRGSACRSRRSR